MINRVMRIGGFDVSTPSLQYSSTPVLRATLAVFTVFGRARAARQVHRGIDERDVSKCLGKVADETMLRCIVFLGQKAEIVGQAEQSFEHLDTVTAAAE